MKKSKIFLKVISIILSILLIIEILPMSVLAQELNDIESTNIDTEVEEATIIGEIESERTENTKHFRLSDGSFIAATYPEPVHYMADGEWEEIDNTLVEKTINGTDYYVNEKASNKVAFSQVLSDESVIIQDADGYEISLTPINDKANKSKGTKKDVEDLTSSKLMKKQAKADKKAEKMEAKNKKSGVKYSDVYSDTDIEYIVTPSTVKENIVVNKKTGKYVYEFNADFGKLAPKLETESVIGLYDTSKKANEPVILVEAPIMYDAAGETSTDVSISFKQNGEKYIVTVTADKEWINDKSREFPVVIDPTVKLDVSRADISDVYVDSENPNCSHLERSTMLVGKNSLGTTRIYVKFKLPDLPDCSIVTGAALVLQQCGYDSVSGSKFIYAYDCGSLDWESSTITWNNQPMNKTDLSSYTVLDYQQYRANASNRTEPYEFNITKAAKNWYENGDNNGIMLASYNESVTVRSEFCTSEYSTNSDYFPSVWISYVNNTGIEDYWTYKTVDLGRSGTVFVNDYNGSLAYVHNDATTSGNRMPASVSHVYSNDNIEENERFDGKYGNMILGKGFRFDILEQIETIPSSEALYDADYRLKFIDGDGTVHFFKKTDTTNQYAHEFNDKLIIQKQSNGQYKMSDEEGNQKIFSAGGYLLKIMDANSNSVTITYSSTNQITKVTDAAGKVITFEYEDNYLKCIKDPAGRATSFTYTVDSNGNKNNILRSIHYPDGKITTFHYAIKGARMSQIIVYDNSNLYVDLKEVKCKNKSFYRVSTLTRKGQADENGDRPVENQLTFSYNNGETQVTDMYGKTNYIYFDNAGRTVNVRDHESNTSYAKYNSSGNKTNTLALQSNTFAPINNLAKNNSAEFTDNGEWYQQLSGGTGSAVITTQEAYVGNKSFKVNSAGTTGRVNICQALTVTPGKTYTLSAYVKIPEDLGNGTGGVALAISYKAANGVWYAVQGDYIKTAQDWRRESFTFTLPADSTGYIGLMLAFFNNSGTAYFDGVQLEENSTMNRYNLLDNSGFDYSNYHWAYSACTSSDGITTEGINGNGVQIYGSPSANKNIYQDVQINGKSGDTVVYGAWAQAYAAGQSNSVSSSTTFKATLTITYTDGTKAYATELFNADVNNPQYICSSYTLTKDCEYIRFYLTYYCDVNEVIFDNTCLYLDNFGSNYEYDSDGKLVTVEDGTGQGISYTYDGPDLTKISQKFDGEEKESCTYTYDEHHNLKTETTKGGVVTEYSYDPPETSTATSTFGNPTKVTVKDSDGTLQSSCTITYTEDYNYLTKVTDSRNGTTEYTYDTVKGVLLSVKDANGNVTTYTYDPNTDALLSTSGQTSSTATLITNSYTYTNDRLTKITHNGFDYGFNYDCFGRVTSTSVAGQTLISHNYNANGTLSQSTYGNGDYVNYSYDSLDRVVSNSYNGIKTFEYDYNKEGLVAKETDYENNIVKNYEYDFARRLVGESSSNGLRSSYTYDERNNIKNLYVTKGDVVLADNEYTYKEDGLADTVKMPLFGDTVQTNHYDSLNRLKKESIYVPITELDPYDIVFDVDYTYVNEPKENTEENENTGVANQTGLIERIKYGSTWIDTSTGESAYGFDKQLAYTYDANGNIKTVSEVTLDADGKEVITLLHTYTYDGLNQLIRHDDAEAEKSYEYYYDNGNLRRIYEYDYSTESLYELMDVKLLTYSSGGWKDQLVNFNGESITYDEIGNVTSYNSNTYEWEKGRQLSSITGNGLNMSFDYNSSGLRTKKVVGNKTIEYYYSGDLLIAQFDGEYWVRFIYSPSGEAIGFAYSRIAGNGELVDCDYCYYVKNVQGDILGFYSLFISIFREYTYDAWGNITGVYNQYGNPVTDPEDPAFINPLRYRSYYYDDESGLYYLNSRYYNPEWGRFISADGYVSTGEQIVAKNMYAYCLNNPANYADPSGAKPVDIEMAEGLGYILDLCEFALQLGLGAVGHSFSTAVRPSNIGVGTFSKIVSSNVKKLSIASNAIGSVISIVGIAIEVIDGVYQNCTKGENFSKIVWDAGLDVAFILIQSETATLIGSAIGSIFFPGYGTMVGAVFGVAIGFGIDLVMQKPRKWVKDHGPY